MQFTYIARNTTGQNQSGELVAETREDAVAKLRQEGGGLVDRGEVDEHLDLASQAWRHGDDAQAA